MNEKPKQQGQQPAVPPPTPKAPPARDEDKKRPDFERPVPGGPAVPVRRQG